MAHNNTVLVTGGAGYIGSHTCKALSNAGYRPVVVDNLSQGHRWAVQWGPFAQADLSDRPAIEQVLRVHGVCAVIHFAAYAHVGESMKVPEVYFRNNVANTLSLLEAMACAGVKQIVFSSTCATYGIPSTIPIVESEPQKPVNPYGESKLFIERALYWQGLASDLRWMALRYFNAAGADPDAELGEEHDPETHLIPLAIGTVLGQRGGLQVMGTDYPTPDGTAIRDYVHVTDLADAHVRALRYLQEGGESTALNVGTGNGHSVREVLKTLEHVTGSKVNARNAPRRPGDPPVLVAAPGRVQKVLDWEPKFSSLETIVQTAYRWHCSQCRVSRESARFVAAT